MDLASAKMIGAGLACIALAIAILVPDFFQIVIQRIRGWTLLSRRR